MENEYLKFYRKQQISPVHQINTDYRSLIRKREKLYRQLGIPVLAIKGSDILEVGPAGGHNSIPLITEWGGEHVDFVEPNEIGRNELIRALKDCNIAQKRYHIFSDMLEKYMTDKQYDIVIAEQFIPQCQNWKELLQKLKLFTKKNSIVIITSIDEIGIYVENMKRMLAHYIVRDITEYPVKLEKLVALFQPSLRGLRERGMTRGG